MQRFLILVGLLLFCAGRADAAVRTETVEYKDGDAVLEGYLAYDDSREGPFTDAQGKRPGILVVHEWKGLNDYAKRRAVELASLGYTAFAADMYGKGILAKDHVEAAKLSGIYRSDRQLMRRRVGAALDVLKSQPTVDPARIGAIGFCFGGTSVLELARSGADVKGTVTFHGGLSTPNPADAKNIKGKVLTLHGADDPYVKPEEVEAFEKEMQDAGVDFRLIRYPGAVHSFTVPEAGTDPSKGMAYNKEAAEKAWMEMERFFAGLFSLSPKK